MEATILKWHKKVGDTIQLDETLLDIATDKVDSEIPSTVEGVIVELLFETNSVVPIGTVIAKIESNQVTKNAIEASGKSTIAPTTTTPISNIKNNPKLEADSVPYIPTVATEPAPTTLSSNDGDKFYSPLVISIAQSEGVSMQELSQINGTGSNGRVSKKDILAYINLRKIAGVPANNIDNQSANIIPETINNISVNNISASSSNALPTKPVQVYEPVPDFLQQTVDNKLTNPNEVIVSGSVEIMEMDRMRKLIAKHMLDSVQTSPHVTSFVEVDVTNIVTWRNQVKSIFEKREGAKLTFTPIFLEGIAAALEKFPILNSSLQGDQIIIKKDINIGMATALPNGNLIVPVIKGANQLSLVGLAKAVTNLANAARNNELKPADTQGGTFTVTNVGTFGSIMGTPIINQPQVAIMALGAIKKRPVVIETAAGDAIVIRHMMYLSMSYDHRIVDGAMGTQFMSAVAENLASFDPNRQWFKYL
jgi:2-oxoglutarate dehydrogenase E2 component (dihydrolipoamide succinyltransferase)